jgi:altronate hydrolase
VTVSGLIPPGHKVATKAIRAGAPVRRYNQIIGFASRDIAPGEHVHLNNLAMGAFERDYAFGADVKPTRYVDPPATFMGIVRADGRVATRNYIGLLSTVNCSATVVRGIAEAFRGDGIKAFPNVDGVVALTHGSGCGMDTHGDGMKLLRRTLGGYARHANFAGVLVVGRVAKRTRSARCSAPRIWWKARCCVQHQDRRHREDHRTWIGIIREMLPHANEVAAARISVAHHGRTQCGGSTAVRDHRQSGARRRGRSAGSPAVRRPVRDARDLWRGALARVPCRSRSARSSSRGSSGGRTTPSASAAK